MYRSIKLLNGKNYSVPDKVADEYEAIRLNMKKDEKPEMEEDPEKKLEMGGAEAEEEDMKKKDMKKKDQGSDSYLKSEDEKGKEQKKKAAEVGDMEEEEYLKKDMKKKDMEHEEEEKKKDMSEAEKKRHKEFTKALTPAEFQEMLKKYKDKKTNSLESENEKLKGQNAALQAKLNSKDEARKETTEVKERIKVINSAADLLKKDPNSLVDLSLTDIKTKVVNSVFPEIPTDGQTDEFISGLFAVAKQNKSESYTKLLDGAMSEKDKYLKSEEAKGEITNEDEMKKQYMEGRKNAYQKPISGNQGDYSKSTSQSGY